MYTIKGNYLVTFTKASFYEAHKAAQEAANTIDEVVFIYNEQGEFVEIKPQ